MTIFNFSTININNMFCNLSLTVEQVCYGNLLFILQQVLHVLLLNVSIILSVFMEEKMHFHCVFTCRLHSICMYQRTILWLNRIQKSN